MIHTDRYLLDVAHAELEIARNVFSEKHDQSGLADVTLQQALIQLRTGQPAEVMKSVSSIASNPKLPPMIVARAQHLLALAQLELGQITDAVPQLEQAQLTYQHRGDRFALSAVLQDLYIAYLKQGNIEQSNQCLQELVALRRKLNSPGALALALNSLGYHYHQRGYYDDAQKTFSEGLEIINATPDPRAEAYLLWSLADLKRDTNRFN